LKNYWLDISKAVMASLSESTPKASGYQLFVENLPPSLTAKELCDVFNLFEVQPIYISIIKPEKNHGFVTFRNPEDTEKARVKGNGYIIVKSGENYPITVNIA
jgi:RNA recognition motif-containing protein